MRPRDLAALEFDQVRNRLADFARSVPAKEACHALTPSSDAQEASHNLETAWQSFRLLEECGEPPLGEFPDIRVALRTAVHEGFVLDGKSLIDIRHVLDAAQATRTFLKKHVSAYPTLTDLPERLMPLPALQGTLRRALDDAGGITDDASDELAAIRRTLRQLREHLTRRLEHLLGRPTMSDMIVDRYVTIRNNRFVIPARTAVVGQLDGVVQDRSVSGETTFIEPLFAVEMNNRLLLAAKEEEALVRRILADLTDMVRRDHEGLEATFATLVAVDALIARARFAQRYRCTQPVLDDAEVCVRQARHPILLFAGREVTPVDLLLPRNKQVLVITGPNTGGKTVGLKTLGLLSLMAQSGVLIPAAEGSRLPCFRSVFADVGDEQSIERNLSTFSAHIVNLKQILEADEPPALVLLDEPGVGTDPDEGAALGIGVIGAFAADGARVIVSTHYASIKVFALSDPRCVTAAVDFDVEALRPRYHLVYHSIGESLALPIARRLGLPEAVLRAAEAARSDNSRILSTAMTQLETSRRHYEERAEQVEEQLRVTSAARREAEELLTELRGKRRRLWSEELDSARAFVRDLRQQGRELLAAVAQHSADRTVVKRIIAAQEAAIRDREAEVAQAEGAPLPAPGPVQLGDLVEVGDQGVKGELLAVEGERAWIQRGSLRFEVAAAALRRLGSKPRPSVAMHIDPPPETTAQEISLIGLRAREAVSALEDFLDRAARARHPSVRIIHGVGSGALRRAVQEFLSTSAYCSAYRTGDAHEGGVGVTIAQLAV